MLWESFWLCRRGLKAVLLFCCISLFFICYVIFCIKVFLFSTTWTHWIKIQKVHQTKYNFFLFCGDLMSSIFWILIISKLWWNLQPDNTIILYSTSEMGKNKNTFLSLFFYSRSYYNPSHQLYITRQEAYLEIACQLKFVCYLLLHCVVTHRGVE